MTSVTVAHKNGSAWVLTQLWLTAGSMPSQPSCYPGFSVLSVTESQKCHQSAWKLCRCLLPVLLFRPRLWTLTVQGAGVVGAGGTLAVARHAVITECTDAVISSAANNASPAVASASAAATLGSQCPRVILQTSSCFRLSTCSLPVDPLPQDSGLSPWNLGQRTVGGTLYLPQHLGQLALNQACASQFSFLFFLRDFFSSVTLSSLMQCPTSPGNINP